jgi:cyanophycin synthetase
VAPTGAAVLNAADPLVANMASHCPGSVVYFARVPANPIVVKHRQQGHRAVLLVDEQVVLADGKEETIVLDIKGVPLTHNGRIGFQIDNVLAATAAAWSLGIDLQTIRNGLLSFGTDLKTLPGRFNLFDLDGRTVVIDYGHNVSSLEAIIEAIDQFPHLRRTVLYSAAGDRRDEDFIRQGELLGHHFDRVILYEDHYLRGRPDGEIMRLFRQGAERGGRRSQIEEIKGWANAMRHALRTVPVGELLLIQADVVDETVDFVKRYLKTRADGREISLDEALDAVLPATEPATVFAAVS